MIKNILNSNNTIFFSTANDNYAIYSAISLITIRKFVPNARLFIISSHLNKKTKIKLTKLKIDFIELNLNNLFYKTWQYPVDCYYMFAGPEIFYKMGYDYSVYIDGDILCNNNPIDKIGDIKFVAGAATNKIKDIFGDDLATINKVFSFNTSRLNSKRFNTGVVYFNNKTAVDKNMLQGVAKIYDICIKNNIPRKGDDSLFCLYLLININDKEVKLLDSRYNFIYEFYKTTKNLKDAIFIHFVKNKPWKQFVFCGNYEISTYKKYIKIYKNHLRRYAPGRYLNILRRKK